MTFSDFINWTKPKQTTPPPKPPKLKNKTLLQDILMFLEGKVLKPQVFFVFYFFNSLSLSGLLQRNIYFNSSMVTYFSEMKEYYVAWLETQFLLFALKLARCAILGKSLLKSEFSLCEMNIGDTQGLARCVCVCVCSMIAVFL